DQWPLSQEKLLKVQELVYEQLCAGHIVPSTSPWNTPIFIIPKKSGKWRLLHDLCAVNAIMEDMGTLQPGLPSPLMIPEKWKLLVIDLKDCFFTIPLHPADAERFVFTVPAVNRAEPAKRYHWVVLPQGMKNSPAICQMFLAWTLDPIRKRYPQYLIYHYMDDILIAGEELEAKTLIPELITQLEGKGLKIAPEKVQEKALWHYLGWIITESQIRPQKIELKTNIKTLSDVQKLVGEIQWIRNICGTTNDDLSPLIQLLETSS
ncbi:hypothetical protein N340_11629, partial [Tauraco erythrolophus]